MNNTTTLFRTNEFFIKIVFMQAQKFAYEIAQILLDTKGFGWMIVKYSPFYCNVRFAATLDATRFPLHIWFYDLTFSSLEVYVYIYSAFSRTKSQNKILIFSKTRRRSTEKILIQMLTTLCCFLYLYCEHKHSHSALSNNNNNKFGYNTKMTFN